MRKAILSLAVIFSFGIYAFFLRSGDISGFLSGNGPQATDLTKEGLSNLLNNITRTTDCVYVPDEDSISGDEENEGEEGKYGGHYKCTTTILSPTPDKTTTPAPSTPTPSAPSVPATSPPQIVTTPPPVAQPKPSTKWKDGTFIGDIVDAFYGNVQVSASISADRLVGVTFLDYPKDRSTSLRKSNKAMPILKSEAISSQSAKVDIVSGVTYTSEAFMQSLASALAQAKI